MRKKEGRHVLGAKPREGVTGVDLDIGARCENEIPESVTQSGKVQQVSETFVILKSQCPFQSTFHSKVESNLAKECLIGSSLRIIITTTGKTWFLITHLCGKLRRTVPFSKMKKQTERNHCRIQLKYHHPWYWPRHPFPGTMNGLFLTWNPISFGTSAQQWNTGFWGWLLDSNPSSKCISWPVT